MRRSRADWVRRPGIRCLPFLGLPKQVIRRWNRRRSRWWKYRRSTWLALLNRYGIAEGLEAPKLLEQRMVAEYTQLLAERDRLVAALAQFKAKEP